jgi:error-prone DNA polymerase
MGFYAPAQLVEDARRHSVEVRPIDINASDWDSTLEPEPTSADDHALRLGLRLVSGLPEEEGRLIVKARRTGNGVPYGSVEDVSRRTGVGRRAIEALAEADAFASLGQGRRSAMWDAKAVERNIPPLLRLVEDTVSDTPLLPEPAADLPSETSGQAIVTDFAATGLTLRAHPLSVLRPRLTALGYHDTRRLNSARPGTSIRLPGLVLMRQRPGTAKGIVFVTLEDEFGIANLVVYANIGQRDRAALIGAKLMVAEGRIERETEHSEVPITHLICCKLLDRSDLLRDLTQSPERAADQHSPAHPSLRQGSSPAFPKSRDFH